MKKVVAIYCGDYGYRWDENTVASGCGGAETWATNLADELQGLGYHVIIFGAPEYWHFSNTGVEYVPSGLFIHRCEYQHFDYFISSRVTSEITPYLECNNVYLMAHEFRFTDTTSLSGLKLDKVKKIACLSDWHRDIIRHFYGDIDDDRFFRTFNGVNQSLYNKETDKKNKMVWSTVKQRGLNEFVTNIFPRIRSEVPDFELDVCGYNNDLGDEDILSKTDGVNVLGRLSKQELAGRQLESKIWIYPNTGYYYDKTGFNSNWAVVDGICHETFCITAVENALAGNAITCLDCGGLSTTLRGYPGMRWSNLLSGTYPIVYVDKANLNQLYDEMAEIAIRMLKEDDYRKQFVKIGSEFCKKYTWEGSALTWISEWEKRVDI